MLTKLIFTKLFIPICTLHSEVAMKRVGKNRNQKAIYNVFINACWLDENNKKLVKYAKAAGALIGI